MKTVKILWETKYRKAEQTTIKDQHGTMTFTQEYIKEFHNSLENGFRWRAV
jgi:hypothetical protein